MSAPTKEELEYAGRCQWDPGRVLPYWYEAHLVKQGGAIAQGGCPNPAKYVMGTRAEWWVCEQCAQLQRFKRLSGKRELTKEEVVSRVEELKRQRIQTVEAQGGQEFTYGKG